LDKLEKLRLKVDGRAGRNSADDTITDSASQKMILEKIEKGYLQPRRL
jgi:hypothetical protein